MTTYRLRDRELQQKLDEISGGCFTESLESIKKPSCIVFQARNGGPAMSVNLTKQDIEQFLEYNPNDWNVFPDVTPPDGVLMRVETEGGRKLCGYYHTFAEGGCWCYEDGTVCPEVISKSVKRYRTWE